MTRTIITSLIISCLITAPLPAAAPSPSDPCYEKHFYKAEEENNCSCDAHLFEGWTDADEFCDQPGSYKQKTYDHFRCIFTGNNHGWTGCEASTWEGIGLRYKCEADLKSTGAGAGICATAAATCVVLSTTLVALGVCLVGAGFGFCGPCDVYECNPTTEILEGVHIDNKFDQWNNPHACPIPS